MSDLHYHVVSGGYKFHLPQIITPYSITAFMEYLQVMRHIVLDEGLSIRSCYEDVVVFEDGSWAHWYACENEFCKILAKEAENCINNVYYIASPGVLYQ